MQRRLFWRSLIAVAVLSLAVMYRETPASEKKGPKPSRAAAAARQNTPDIAYTVSMSRPSTHLLEVEMRLKWQQMPSPLRLKMPVWTPGSYLIREYARHVQNFGVTDSAGKPLRWEKINKNTWQIETGGSRELVASYKVYANELTVRTNELNSEHAFWNNAALLMFPDGRLSAPSTVSVKPFGNWKVATGLPKVSGRANTFRAENYDVLYDSPFEVSDFKEITFRVRGVPHRFVVTGEGNYDLQRVAEDTAKIAEEATKIFGELPVENYLFILNLRGRGGLEHLNSTALQWNRFNFKPRANYLGFLALVAHEYFHLWNVKRIRPDALGPFDYENENYTKLLWVAEGITAYYEAVLLRRAGLITADEFLSGKAAMIRSLQTRPGRFETSLEEASLDAWIKYYRQDENAINNQVSYYDKGEIVAMMLDIEIRSRSGGRRSLDDVMRYLYTDFAKKNRNFTPDDFQKTAERAAGGSLAEFFSKYVRGESEIDYNAIVNGVGLRLKASEPNKGAPYIGADLAEDAGRLTVKAVPADSPAYQQGLNVNDQIVAIDGYRAGTSFLQTYLNEKEPGDRVRLTIFRFDKLQEIDFTLGDNTRAEYEFEAIAEPTAIQRRLYRDYLGEDI